MSRSNRRQRGEPQKNPTGTTRKAAIIVGVVCVGVVAAFIALNFDRLAAGPGASASTGKEADWNSASNAAPVMLSVTPATGRLEPLGVCQLVCKAAADDGGALTYTWTATHGDIIGEGATVDWHAPATEGLFRVSVTVDDGRGGIDEYSIVLSVKVNHPPYFRTLELSAEEVRPGASVSISCSAVDVNGDDITYEWYAADGEVRGEGTSIEWIAPEEPGSYVITITVRDTYGGETKRDLLVSVTPVVTPSLTPKLGTFVVQALNHDLLRYALGVYDTFPGLSYSIECVVLQGDEPYTYEWSADAGTLTADGATAIWQAPETPGSATITVAVTDALGNTNSGQVFMYVGD